MKIRNLNIASILLIVLFAAGLSQAQQAQKIGPDKDDDNKEHSLPCRQDKTVINAQGPTGKANLDRSDFPDNFSPTVWNALENPATNAFNQTVADQAFAYTFKFPAWTNSGKCCRCIEGATLTVKLKALIGGGINSASSWNDDVVVYSSLAPGPAHQVVFQRIWPQGASVATGQTEILTFKIPCKYLTNGHLSFYVEDDTAVLSAQLSLSRCCLENVR